MSIKFAKLSRVAGRQISLNAIMERPQFTIAIPTYNRAELLRYTVNTIIQQDFPSFEILIGNDYVSKPITTKSLGIDDKRIKIINNKKNLGEIENMNSLLNLASGEYFTWQFDDDFYVTNILGKVHAQISKHPTASAIFTSFRLFFGDSGPEYENCGFNNGNSIELSGANFLENVLNGQYKAMGACGFFKINYIKEIGGAPSLSDSPIGLYSEYHMLLEIGKSSKVIYLPAPFICYRDHEDSWSGRNKEVQLYIDTGLEFIRRFPIFLNDSFYVGKVNEVFGELYKMIENNIIIRMVASSGWYNKNQLDEFRRDALLISENIISVQLREIYLDVLVRIQERNIYGSIFKGLFKTIPSPLQKLLRRIRAIMHKYASN
jgi:glycosyltransferase involved in cell wall biosynthesis